MYRTGLCRKGSLLMVLSISTTLLSFLVPFVLAAAAPTHEFMMTAEGWKALLAQIFYPCMFIMYAVGCSLYAADKGYGKVLGVILAFAVLPGLVVLLLLPDLKHPLITLKRSETFSHHG